MQVHTQILGLTISRPRITRVYPLTGSVKIVIPRYQTHLRQECQEQVSPTLPAVSARQRLLVRAGALAG